MTQTRSASRSHGSRRTLGRLLIRVTASLLLVGLVNGCRTTDANLVSAHVAAARLSQAQDKLLAGSPREAIPLFNRLIEEPGGAPTDRIEALLGRAECHSALGERTLARVDVRIAGAEARETFSADATQGEAIFRRIELLLAQIEAVAIVPTTATVTPSRPPRSVTSSAPVSRPASGPMVESRGEWQAAGLRANHDPMTRIHRVTVHHTGTVVSTDDFEATAKTIRSIQRYHQDSRGWADIGYHYLIDRAGRVWEGREITVQGAHAGNSTLNAGNIGIAIIGNYEEQPLQSTQQRSLYGLLDHLRSRYGIDAREVLTHGEILKQNHAGGTACPGDQLERVVADYRIR